jgi:hypothetical protein
MKRLLLINTNTERAPYPVPPLGLSLLAVALEKDYEVHIWDGMFRKPEGLPEFVQQWQPDYIGFSIRNIDDILIDRVIFYVDEIIRDFIEPVKKVSNAPIILGGSGFSIFPDELMKMTGADYGIAGEGEEALLNLLSEFDTRLQEQRIPSSSNHLIFKSSNPHIFKSSNSNIDKHIDFTPYKTKGVYSIQTKRGCSHVSIAPTR